MRVKQSSNIKVDDHELVDPGMVTVYDMGRLEYTNAGFADGGGFTFGTDFSVVTSRRIDSAIENENEKITICNGVDRKASGIDSKCDKNSETPILKRGAKLDTWTEFISGTTFHGVRYIFKEDGLCLRKFLWTAFVVIAVGLFSYQVIDRAKDYYAYQSNINVQVVYEKSVPFPTVTICNQNNFRISEAVDRNLYDFIDQFYSGSSNIDFNASRSITNDTFECAHELEDFIERCSWSGQSCNVTQEFTTSITDFGICYSFNSNDKRRYDVAKTGTKSGLSLVLNIESYEYMRGPHNEAGIKMLLHDNEAPLVQDLGFAVPPGTNTLVAINRADVASLQPPYGYCKQGAEYRTNCVIECRRIKMMEACKCIDQYMQRHVPNESLHVCTEPEELLCSRERNSATEECPACPIPCHQIKYKPELSYAHLSSVSLDNIWQSNPETQEKVSLSFRKAREVRQHANKFIARKDKESFDFVSTSLATFSTELALSSGVLGNKSSGINSLYYSYDIFIETFETMLKAYETLGLSFTERFPSTRDLQETNLFMQMVKEQFLGLDNETMSSLVRCISMTDMWKQLVQCSLSRGTRLAGVQDAIVFNGCGSLCLQRRRAINELTNLSSKYIARIDNLFEDSTLLGQVKSSESVKICLGTLESTTAYWTKDINALMDMMIRYANETSYTIKLDHAHDIEEKYNTIMANGKELIFQREEEFNRANPTCNWFLKTEEELTGDKKYSLLEGLMDSAQNTLLDIQDLSKFDKQGKKLEVATQNMSIYLKGKFSSYLFKRISKEHLHRLMFSEESKTRTDAFVNSFYSYSNTYLDYLNELTSIKTSMKSIIEVAYQLPIDIMRNDTVYRLELMKFYRRSAYVNKCSVQEIADWGTEAGQAALRTIMECMLDDYYVTLDTNLVAMKDSYSSLLSAMDRVTQELTEYVKGNVIDVNFFLSNYIQVDIFYKELSYERVNQQISFTFISLLSEVGGFLGLLLGASVLTVCEVFDYMAIVSLKKCRKKNL